MKVYYTQIIQNKMPHVTNYNVKTKQYFLKFTTLIKITLITGLQRERQKLPSYIDCAFPKSKCLTNTSSKSLAHQY